MTIYVYRHIILYTCSYIATYILCYKTHDSKLCGQEKQPILPLARVYLCVAIYTKTENKGNLL